METHNPDDALAVYVKEVGNVEPLTKDEEAKLFRELAGHGVRDEMRATVAERRLIEGHLAQVVSIAQNHSTSGVPMLDLIQEGNLGLMDAIKNFAEKPVGDFTDYAARCIDDAIKARLGS
jgi:DNA-directed RNA polymerase sigma subunit (sigma70/sigma32)